jgi:hypothetical protein
MGHTKSKLAFFRKRLRLRCPEFSSDFLRFRFDYASLVWDCVAALGRNSFRWHARLAALVGLPFLLVLPAAILIVGSDPFGNVYAFGGALILWPFFLEIPGHMLRQAAVLHNDQPEDPTKFDFFLFVIFTSLAIGAQLLLFARETSGYGQVELGIIWGVALAGGVDCVRTAVASILATTRGYPLYGERPLKDSAN